MVGMMIHDIIGFGSLMAYLDDECLVMESPPSSSKTCKATWFI